MLMVKYSNVGDAVDRGLEFTAVVSNITAHRPEPVAMGADNVFVVAGPDADTILDALRACQLKLEELECVSAVPGTFGMCVAHASSASAYA